MYGHASEKASARFKNARNNLSRYTRKCPKKEALRMLDAGNVNLTDIALQLGYAELSIFSRNFKSWFGVPPTELKDKSRSHIV
ncbi:helix-turn-helix domain-containing protein [Acinetobacter johnsonii]|nr:helix-turn-helix domain-containing protein [Acinetobacter johnsonii]WEI03673.1 helix-turn-helix domain-containing protein [Acinetobacter johnsonii]